MCRLSATVISWSNLRILVAGRLHCYLVIPPSRDKPGLICLTRTGFQRTRHTWPWPRRSCRVEATLHICSLCGRSWLLTPTTINSTVQQVKCDPDLLLSSLGPKVLPRISFSSHCLFGNPFPYGRYRDIFNFNSSASTLRSAWSTVAQLV